MHSILLTAIGKRVQLVKHLQSHFKVVGTDAGLLNPAKKFTDFFYQIPKWNEEKYLSTLLDICVKENIKLLIPLYEKEFLLLAQNRKEFEQIGTKLLLSDERVIEICNDKWSTYEFFKGENILTPQSYKSLVDEVTLPAIIKPLDGMGSEGVYKVKSTKELNFFYEYVSNPIIQELIVGTEYTIDVLCDFTGNVITAVPRERLEVRAGEVSKSRTVKNKAVIDKTLDLVNKLNKYGKVIGPMTIQCFQNDSGIYFIEINPRFGGGVPLSFEAGADYAECLEKMVDGKPMKSQIGLFEELTMLRYDQAVYQM